MRIGTFYAFLKKQRQRSLSRSNQENIDGDPLSILIRASTSRQIADVCGLHFYEVTKHLAALMKGSQVRSERRNEAIYYVDVNREVHG